jgi:hypothetical protein
MQELNRRHAPVLVHSAVPNCCGVRDLAPGITTGELDFDEARCAQSLLVNGTLIRYWSIRELELDAGCFARSDGQI